MTTSIHTIPELLAPAGTLEQLEAAILYGADAVYLGGTASLRAARTFSGDTLVHARNITRAAGVQLYFCCNAFPRQRGWAKAMQNLEEGAKVGVDAFIIADAGVFNLARKHFPHIPIHVSTQANTCNEGSTKFWQEQGATRVNMARELRLTEVRGIKRACPDMEIECFVHGAQCLAISGQCLLSAWLNERPANEGECTQPCRFQYRPMPEQSLMLEESMRPGHELWQVTQGEEGFSAVWSPEDLCLLYFVPWFVREGITSLKIEGRMRSGGYVAHAVDVYRQALNLCAQGISRPEWRSAYASFIDELAQCAVRALGSGFFVPKHQIFAPAPARKAKSSVLARLESEESSGIWRISVRGRWDSALPVRLMLPGGKRLEIKPNDYKIENHKQVLTDVVHSGTEARFICEVQGLRSGIYVESIIS